MTGPLIAEKIKITAFRGITEPIVLDFSAPVTLVYAPNGTGKTTFCEAVEWLLTGQVERLREGQWTSDVLRSAFLDNAVPEVEADLLIGDQRHHMWRTPDGGWLDQRDGAPRRPGDLLELLAPSAAAPDKHHNSAISLRQHYLRGTRFLTSEALAALVDNSDDSLERRKDVFADLLGIRHLRDAEQASEKYISDLAPYLRDVDTRRKALTAEMAQLRAELKDEATAAKTADASLSAAVSLLNLAALDGDIPSRIQAVAGAIAKLRHDLTRRTEALDQVAPVWSRKPELDAHIAALKAADQTAAQALDAAQAARKQAEDQHRACAGTTQAAATQVGRLEAAEVSLRTSLEAVVRAATLAKPYLETLTPSLTALLANAPETRWDATTRASRREALRAAVGAEARVDQILAEQARVASQRTELSSRVPTPEALKALRAALEAGDAAAARARAEAEAIAGPVATLQSAGRAVVDHQHDDETDCPLCGADWRERTQLLAAVQRTLDAAPALVAAARALADTAATAAVTARKALADAVQLQTQLNALDDENRALEARLETERRILGVMEAPVSGPLRRRVLDWAELRLNLADSLAALSALQTANLLLINEDNQRFIDAHLPVTQLRSSLDQTLATRRRGLEAVRDAAQREEGAADAALTASTSAEASKLSALEAVRRDLTAAEKELAAILALWATAAGAQAWTPDGLHRQRADLQAALTKIEAAERELAGARGAWDVEAKHVRLATLEASLAPLNAKHARLKASSDTADALRMTFKENYIATSQAQVGGLSRVVNALFLRMHANRVVDRIDLGQSDTFLQWFADAGSAQLEPGRDFSQGQRQDLALALFLARARGLGGTFFLDEPVAHLDDLNRVGLMDVFRAVATEAAGRVRLVITTSSRSLARHMVEKFGTVDAETGLNPTMRVIELTGNGRLGVRKQQVYPIGA